MPAKLVTLISWARDTFGDAAPTLGTLRRWARESRIYPRPVKAGRTYFVAPEARYIDISESPRQVAAQVRPGSLVARLMQDGRKTA